MPADTSAGEAATAPASARGASVESPADAVTDALTKIRAQLTEIDELPLDARVERFEQINAAIVAQLAELDEL